jgi:hypothetical protein
MLGKIKKSIEWSGMLDQDRLYLIEAYKRYESLFKLPADTHKKIDSFQNWLLKRGVRKPIEEQNQPVTH